MSWNITTNKMDSRYCLQIHILLNIIRPCVTDTTRSVRDARHKSTFSSKFAHFWCLSTSVDGAILEGKGRLPAFPPFGELRKISCTPILCSTSQLFFSWWKIVFKIFGRDEWGEVWVDILTLTQSYFGHPLKKNNGTLKCVVSVTPHILLPFSQSLLFALEILGQCIIKVTLLIYTNINTFM